VTRVWPVADEGLGNSSYLAEVAEGVGLVVDPGRDPRPYLRLATAHGLRIGFTVDTRPQAIDMQNGCVLDVRQDTEWAAGHLSGAAHRELGSLTTPAAAAGLPEGPLAVMCGHGERAMTAASLLAAAGTGGVSVLLGGPADWAKATGQPPPWSRGARSRSHPGCSPPTGSPKPTARGTRHWARHTKLGR
jgi:rhodanese-related sulfurtransferase